MKPARLLFLLTLFFSLSLPSFSEPDSPKAPTEVKKKGGESCHLPSKEGEIRGVCKHCGCRMQYDKADAQKLCEHCKCKLKNEECLHKN